MAKSGIHERTPSYLNQINNLMVEESYSLKSYPASVTELSAMLVHAHKESLPERDPTPSRAGETTRAVFKKSHTCGSLYAKCGCNDETDTFPYPHDPQFSAEKRSSNPSLSSVYPRADTKRLSSPEIHDFQHAPRHPQVCLTPKFAKNPPRNVVKANVYLNHPEINFPIPVEVPKEDCDKLVPKQSKSLSNLYPEIKNKLDYHKYTALVYESQHQNHHNYNEEEARKFLRDFGIFGPMGNGVATNLRKSSKSSVDEEAIQQIRRNSKSLSEVKKRGSVSHEDYEYLKSIVSRLKKELSELEAKYEASQSELHDVKKNLTCKESEVLRLQREVHKLKVKDFVYLFFLEISFLYILKNIQPKKQKY